MKKIKIFSIILTTGVVLLILGIGVFLYLDKFKNSPEYIIKDLAKAVEKNDLSMIEEHIPGFENKTDKYKKIVKEAQQALNSITEKKRKELSQNIEKGNFEYNHDRDRFDWYYDHLDGRNLDIVLEKDNESGKWYFIYF